MRFFKQIKIALALGLAASTLLFSGCGLGALMDILEDEEESESYGDYEEKPSSPSASGVVSAGS